MAHPNEAEVMQLAEQVADRMGRASAMYKYASDCEARGDVKRAQFVVASIPQDWVPLLQDLHAAGRA